MVIAETTARMILTAVIPEFCRWAESKTHAVPKRLLDQVCCSVCLRNFLGARTHRVWDGISARLPGGTRGFFPWCFLSLFVFLSRRGSFLFHDDLLSVAFLLLSRTGCAARQPRGYDVWIIEPDVGVLGDAQEHLSVVGKESPRRGLPSLHVSHALGSCLSTRRPSSPVFSMTVKPSCSSTTRSGAASCSGRMMNCLGLPRTASYSGIVSRMIAVQRGSPHSQRYAVRSSARENSMTLSSSFSFASRKVDSFFARCSALLATNRISPRAVRVKRFAGSAGGTIESVDASDEQRARNELLFREVNERVEEINERLDGESEDSLMVFVCECGNTACNDQIELGRREYEGVRANPKHFAVLPGHEDLNIARVVEEHDGFLVAEKIGEAAELAIEHDPRT
jgi:hypothetical protein